MRSNFRYFLPVFTCTVEEKCSHFLGDLALKIARCQSRHDHNSIEGDARDKLTNAQLRAKAARANKRRMMTVEKYCLKLTEIFLLAALVLPARAHSFVQAPAFRPNAPKLSQELQSKRALSSSNDAVMLLDLDMTSIYGNDGNDMGLALQWMEKSKQTVDGLYGRLVSPLLRPAYEQMKERSDNLDVVIYTRRPTMLNYRSCFRDCVIPLHYQKLIGSDGQLYIPGDIKTPAQMLRHYCGPELLPEEKHDVEQCLQRLLSARDALTASLDLASPPTVVVTAEEKQVPRTVQHLGLSSQAFLFDDNTLLRQTEQIVRVDPLTSLPAENRQALLDFMEQELPVSKMESELIEFLLGAPAADRAIEWDAAVQQYRWRVPLASGLRPWKIPLSGSAGASRTPPHRSGSCHASIDIIQTTPLAPARGISA